VSHLLQLLDDLDRQNVQWVMEAALVHVRSLRVAALCLLAECAPPL
jgi:hypothetical protein